MALRSVGMRAWEDWKRAQDREGKFYGATIHRCARECRVVPVPIFMDKSTGNVTLQPTQTPVHAAYLSVWACEKTGSPHICGQGVCDALVENDGGDMVCRFTGIVMSQHESNHYEFGYALPPLQKFESDADPTNLLQRGASPKDVRNVVNKRAFFAQCTLALEAVFSPARFDEEMADYRRHCLGRALEKLHDYIRRRERQRRPPVLLEMVRIVSVHRSNFALPTRVSMPAPTLRRLATEYTTTIMAMWHVVRKYGPLPLSHKITSFMNTRKFIAAAMELLQEGIYLTVPGRLNDFEAVPADSLLCVPMTTIAQAKILGKPMNLRRFRESICTCMQEALNRDPGLVQHMHVTQYEYEALPAESFARPVK